MEAASSPAQRPRAIEVASVTVFMNPIRSPDRERSPATLEPMTGRERLTLIATILGSAFHLGMLLAAGLLVAGGTVALVGVRNPERPKAGEPAMAPS